ncbi:hypothetical protein L208DRAFT_1379801 [Tricholoma matsutake]|nr:hypothetical protein L208DRAFT_1379801 [Tricholoma matsutake 945]
MWARVQGGSNKLLLAAFGTEDTQEHDIKDGRFHLFFAPKPIYIAAAERLPFSSVFLKTYVESTRMSLGLRSNKRSPGASNVGKWASGEDEVRGDLLPEEWKSTAMLNERSRIRTAAVMSEEIPCICMTVPGVDICDNAWCSKTLMLLRSRRWWRQLFEWCIPGIARRGFGWALGTRGSGSVNSIKAYGGLLSDLYEVIGRQGLESLVMGGVGSDIIKLRTGKDGIFDTSENKLGVNGPWP